MREILVICQDSEGCDVAEKALIAWCERYKFKTTLPTVGLISVDCEPFGVSRFHFVPHISTDEYMRGKKINERMTGATMERSCQ